jgi:meiosis induction protein kinase IME2/SME1
MTVLALDNSRYRHSTVGMAPLSLEDRFEVIKEIGDGSFGSVVLARVRTAGAHVARRGTMVSSTFFSALQGPQNVCARLTLCD